MKRQVWRVLTGDLEDTCINVYCVCATEKEAREIAAQIEGENCGAVARVVEAEADVELLGLLPGDATEEEIDEFFALVARRIDSRMKQH